MRSVNRLRHPWKHFSQHSTSIGPPLWRQYSNASFILESHFWVFFQQSLSKHLQSIIKAIDHLSESNKVPCDEQAAPSVDWPIQNGDTSVQRPCLFLEKKKRVINLVKNKCALNGSDFRPLNGLPVRNVGRCSRKDVKILTGRYRRTHNELRRGAVKNVQSVHLFFFYIPPPLEATEASDN